MTTLSTLHDFTGQYIQQYLLTSLLGYGASGYVYRGVDTSSENQISYAVKCMSKIDLTPEGLLQQTSEVFHHQLVTGCSSSILSLKDVIQDEKYLWIVLELCEGGDLYEAIHETRVFRSNDSLIKEAFVEILDGVYACHMKGVFHRDLKPENILCKNKGTDMRIADFGLATRQRICRGMRCGTYEYMSPECYLVTKNSMFYPSLADVWALGIILINMVTSKDPWQAACVSDRAFSAFLANEDYLFETLPISRPLNELLKWILHPNPFVRLCIPQIKQAILKMDSFYRIPTFTTSLRFNLKEADFVRGNVVNTAGSEGLSDGSHNAQQHHNRARGCRPRPQPGLSFIDNDSEAMNIPFVPKSKVAAMVRLKARAFPLVLRSLRHSRLVPVRG